MNNENQNKGDRWNSWLVEILLISKGAFRSESSLVDCVSKVWNASKTFIFWLHSESWLLSSSEKIWWEIVKISFCFYMWALRVCNRSMLSIVNIRYWFVQFIVITACNIINYICCKVYFVKNWSFGPTFKSDMALIYS